ncbi:MAG: DUF1266 domain-containing protein [Clostridiales Family XIII bacterium]|jgi:hypothetical protein|nr:DUF1266 domain-containing protein [Clostridiales Family XIII bacterium]
MSDERISALVERMEVEMKSIRVLPVWILIFVLLFATVPTRLSAAGAAVTPTPPSWCTPEDYAIFEGSAVYEPENWAAVLRARSLAEEEGMQAFYKIKEIADSLGYSILDGGDGGVYFEFVLIYCKLVSTLDFSDESIFYSAPVRDMEGPVPHGGFELEEMLKISGEWGSHDALPVMKWCARSIAFRSQIKGILPYMSVYDDFDRKAFLDEPWFDVSRARFPDAFAENYDNLLLLLDGVFLSIVPVLVNGRAMIPIRSVAEHIGGRVDWEAATKTATITRAEKEVRLRIGDKTAYINGEPMTLDAAPYIDSEGLTFLPLRFVSEALSQKVTYVDKNRCIDIREDMSFEKDSNLKAWILGCSSIIAFQNSYADPYTLGMYRRSADHAEISRGILSSSWGSDSREDLIATIYAMTDDGHNASFETDAALAKSFTAQEMREILAEASDVDRYMWPYVIALDKKWGEKGIKAWDWFRMMHLISWGYMAGYLELDECYLLAEPIAQRLRSTFGSWDEATENYLDGYAYWSRTDVTQEDTMYRERAAIYEYLKSAENVGRGGRTIAVETIEKAKKRDARHLTEYVPNNTTLYDPTVWTEPVRGI